MNLEERLRDLCEAGERNQAKSLALGALANERVQSVALDDDVVRLATPNFRGVHRLRTDGRGRVDVHPAGEYTFESDDVDLSFSTTGMTPGASDLVQERVADLNEERSRASTDDGEEPDGGSVPPAESVRAETDADGAVVDPPARFRPGILDGLF